MAFFKIAKFVSLGQTTRQATTLKRLFFSTSITYNNMSKFEEAKQKLTTLKVEPDNENKLKLYALYKQATVGQCNVKKPGMMDFVGKAKWEAWNSLGNMKQEEAQLKYVNFVDGLLYAHSTTSSNEPTNSSGTASSNSDDDVVITVDGKITLIRLNRPSKKNALLFNMYPIIIEALEKAASDDSSIVVLTGTGDYYCSGNDLSNFMVDPSTINTVAAQAAVVLEQFVSAFIDFPKPLIALVNGPAVGIAVTLLGLCDTVYASDTATFTTPFSSLGQSPEGCSSVTFPAIMGNSLAKEVLYFGRKLSAEEALKCGFISRVFPNSSFQTDAWEHVKKFALLPQQSMTLSKSLTRYLDKEALHRINKRECEILESRWKSEDCLNAIMNFFQRKSKL